MSTLQWRTECFKTLREGCGGELQKKNDPLSPNHYKLKCGDSWDYQIEICSQVPGDEAALLFNVLKYCTRYSKKNGLEDVKKALMYLNKLIEIMEKKNDTK